MAGILSRLVIKDLPLVRGANLRRYLRFLVVALAATLPTLIIKLYPQCVPAVPAVIFFLVVVASWNGGFGSGVVALVFATMGPEIFSPSLAAAMGQGDLFRLVLLTAVVFIVSWRDKLLRGWLDILRQTVHPATLNGNSESPGSLEILNSFHDTAIAAVDEQL